MIEALAGKVALVTGGGRGIGRSTALALARGGADVAVVARSSGEIEAVAEEVRALGRRSVAVPCDVTRYDVCVEAVRRGVGRMLDIGRGIEPFVLGACRHTETANQDKKQGCKQKRRHALAFEADA